MSKWIKVVKNEVIMFNMTDLFLSMCPPESDTLIRISMLVVYLEERAPVEE